MLSSILRRAILATTLVAVGCASPGTGGVNDSVSTMNAGNAFTGLIEDTRISYSAELPHCGDELVLRRIARRVPAEMRNTLHRHLAVVEFEHPHQTSHVSADHAVVEREVHHPKLGRLVKKEVVGKRQVSQRFCRVRALFSDHRKRNVHYVIETPMGFAGIGHNVTFCVAGLDPWYVHGRHCSSLSRR